MATVSPDPPSQVQMTREAGRSHTLGGVQSGATTLGNRVAVSCMKLHTHTHTHAPTRPYHVVQPVHLRSSPKKAYACEVACTTMSTAALFIKIKSRNNPSAVSKEVKKQILCIQALEGPRGGRAASWAQVPPAPGRGPAPALSHVPSGLPPKHFAESALSFYQKTLRT